MQFFVRQLGRCQPSWRVVLICILAIPFCFYIFMMGGLGYVSPKRIQQPSSAKVVGELTKEEVERGELEIEQDDPRLINYIRKYHLIPPINSLESRNIEPKNGSDDERFNSDQQAFVRKLLKNKKNGVYLECGACTGDFIPNTLGLEIEDGWTGMLIEADSKPFAKMINLSRNAWLGNICLATTTTPIKIEMLRRKDFDGWGFIKGYRHFIGNEADYEPFSSQCFPLYSILLAAGITQFDYFSFDIEGAELKVLETVPWDSVIFKVISIEVHEKYVEPVWKFMTGDRVGYKYVTFIKNKWSHDQIYVHPSLNIDHLFLNFKSV